MKSSLRAGNAVVLAVLLSLLQGSAARATQMIPQSVAQLTARANLVVRAVPIDGTTTSRWIDPDGAHLIVTSSRFKVLEVLKGNVAVGDEIVVERFGGTVGDISMAIVGMASFAADEQVLLFLRNDVDGALRILDVSAGKFEIIVGPGGQELLTRRALEDVRMVGGTAEVPATLGEMRGAVRRASQGVQP